MPGYTETLFHFPQALVLSEDLTNHQIPDIGHQTADPIPPRCPLHRFLVDLKTGLSLDSKEAMGLRATEMLARVLTLLQLCLETFSRLISVVCVLAGSPGVQLVKEEELNA